MIDVRHVERLTNTLREASGYEATAIELAEILWLAQHLPAVGVKNVKDAAAAREETKSTQPSQGSREQQAKDPAPKESAPSRSGQQAASPQSRTGLYARTGAAAAASRRASLVRGPGEPALPHALALSRALRPLLKKRVSTRLWQFDEDATAEATATNNNRSTPVFKPGTERWFDLALVVDRNKSMHVWKQAVVELRRLLVRHGGLRDLRQYGLRVEGQKINVVLESGRTAAADVLADPSGRRLIVLVTDAVSPDWRRRPLRRAIAKWGRLSPVVLLHVLPRRLWPHTAVGFAERVMSPHRAGAPNSQWFVDRDWWETAETATMPLPVISLEAGDFATWARALMQVSATVCTGMLLTESDVDVITPKAEKTPAQRVQSFRSAATPLAYQLACYFATTHVVVLPILRIIQRTMAPASGPGHLAEFLLSDLIFVQAPTDDPEQTAYQFHPGVDEILLDQLRTDEVPRVAKAIEEYLEVRLGRSYDLMALVKNPRGRETIAADAEPFVTPTLSLLERMGFRPKPIDNYVDSLGPNDLKALAPLAVVFADRDQSPDLPEGLWDPLFKGVDLKPLEAVGGVTYLPDKEERRLVVDRSTQDALLARLDRDLVLAGHGKIAAAYSSRSTARNDDGYYYKFFLRHLAASGSEASAQGLVFDADWVARRIQAESITAFLDDLRRFPQDRMLTALLEVALKQPRQWEDPIDWSQTLLREFVNRGVPPAGESRSEPLRPGPEPTRPEVWVSVVGTGFRTINQIEREATRAVARALVECGYGLISGSWPGVDAAVTEDFAAARRAAGRDTDSALVELLKPNQKSVFQSSEHVVYDSDAAFREFIFRRAAALVVIGGGGLVVQTGQDAITRLLPVIPMAYTGGDAAKVFDNLVQLGELFASEPLAIRVSSPEATDAIYKRLRDLLERGIRPDVRARALCRAYADSPRVDTDKCEARLLALIAKHAFDILPTLDPDSGVRDEQLLYAVAYRAVSMKSAMPELLTTNKSPVVSLQRLKSLQFAFAHRDLRATLPPDLGPRLLQISNVFSRLDDERTGWAARRVKTLITETLSPLALLLAAVADVRSTTEDAAPLGSPAVTADLARDFLADPHPGWRLAGLVYAEAVADRALLPLAIDATVFEATFAIHTRTAMAAVRRMLERPDGASISADEQTRVSDLLRRFPGGTGASELAALLHDTAVGLESVSDDRSGIDFVTLVKRYNDVRAAMSASDERTAILEQIVSAMARVDPPLTGDALRVRLDDRDRGWRLAAYVCARNRPEPALWGPLCKSLLDYRSASWIRRIAVGPDNRPFGEYHGLLALDAVDSNTKALTKSEQNLLRRLLAELSERSDRDRKIVLARIRARHRYLETPDDPNDTETPDFNPAR